MWRCTDSISTPDCPTAKRKDSHAPHNLRHASAGDGARVFCGFSCGPVLAAGPVRKGIAGGATKSCYEIADGRTALEEALD
jgi:hypothetical protein